MSSAQSKAAYLKSIPAVRDRCSLLLSKALKNQLQSFDVDTEQLNPIADYVVEVIRSSYSGPVSELAARIPPHGRWQHFEVGDVPRLANLLSEWESNNVDKLEIARRLIDLFTVSVLLDAGAGSLWKYTESDGTTSSRSEGLAVASLHMFTNGLLSDGKEPIASGPKLRALTVKDIETGFQVSDRNPLLGVEGRTHLLNRLGSALESHPQYFGSSQRPGNLVDYLLLHGATVKNGPGSYTTDLTVLWDALMDGLNSIWPQDGRTKLDGTPLGDAWKCSTMPVVNGEEWESIVPFHKLTQWLCYSLLVPLKKFVGFKFIGEELQTGLPEYRNGGLLVDFDLLKLKPELVDEGLNLDSKHDKTGIPAFTVDSNVIVEWRAVTIGFLDLILTRVNQNLGITLSLAQLIEAGTWSAGRKIAATKRPDTRNPPISIVSDGTVF